MVFLSAVHHVPRSVFVFRFSHHILFVRFVKEGVCARFSYVQLCVCVCSPCSVSSAGNVTPVPGIAASLDPGNSDDRNRRLLPLRRAYCLATGSLHTRPKPLPKASYSFAAILFLTSVPLVPLVVLSFCSLNDPDLLFNPVLLLFLPVVH